MIQNRPDLEVSIRFVANHYKEGIFDSGKGWKKISTSIPDLGKKRRMGVRKTFTIAAAAVLLFIIGFGIYKMANQTNELLAENNDTQFVLPDLTKVVMQKGAKLSYDKDFRGTTRHVSMHGEIEFSVFRDETKPFIVSTPVSQIEVLGTVFTVDADYETTSLKVTQGIVEFTAKDPAIPIRCTAGMNLRYNAEEQEIAVFSDDNEMEINGKIGTVRFNNMKLKDVVTTLSHFYDVDLSLPENEAELTFSSTFSQKSIIEVVNIINITLNSHITIDE